MELRQLYEDYLNRIGRLKPLKAGGKDESQPVSPEINSFFFNRLGVEVKQNNQIITILLIMYSLLFILSIYFVIHYRGSLSEITLAFGGAGVFGFLLLIIKNLQRFWVSKNTIEILRAVIPNLPSNEVPKVVESIYYQGKLKDK